MTSKKKIDIFCGCPDWPLNLDRILKKIEEQDELSSAKLSSLS